MDPPPARHIPDSALILGLFLALGTSTVSTAARAGTGCHQVLAHRTFHRPAVALRPARPRGRLLDFWATSCGPCRAALPALQRLHRRYPSLAVQGITLDDGVTPALVRPILRQYGVTFPVAAVPVADARLARRYGVQLYPTLFLLDEGGRVVWSHSGALDARTQEALVVRIDALLTAPGAAACR